MINREDKPSVVRQAKLLGFSRGSLYYSLHPVSDGNLALMRRIDERHLDYRLPEVGCCRAFEGRRAEGWTAARRYADEEFEDRDPSGAA